MTKQTIKNRPLEDFLSYLEVEKNRSANTIDNYRFYLMRFFDWCSQSQKKRGFIRPQNINLPLVRKYRVYLNRLSTIDGEPLKKSTQNYHLIALRSFLKFLAKHDMNSLAAEKIELGKMPDRQINFLDGEEVFRLLDAPAKDPGEKLRIGDLRDKAILEVLFSTGLRVSELSHLKREDINLRKKKRGTTEFTVRGKGKKVRLVFLSERAAYWLKEYLDRRIDTSPWMFVRMDKAANALNDEAPMTPRSMQRLVEKYSHLAGITKRITPHTLRHTFATDLLANDADIRSVQSMLGHSSITTTQVYTHITDKHLREAHNKFHNRRKK
ncbi:tyrosine-type recombinase/integrase [Patescibacteria group bacterium]|nr:tyrosine-type recombinase/integrase [Patescibacteria group bacterium]